MRAQKQRHKGLAKAIAAAGSISELAIRLDITVQAVSQWFWPPPERCADIERETGIPRAELRPDIYGAWPGRKRQPAARAA